MRGKVKEEVKEGVKEMVKIVEEEVENVRKTSLPLYPKKVSQERRRRGESSDRGGEERRGGDSRRHSWAGARGPLPLPPTKHTSLQVII